MASRSAESNEPITRGTGNVFADLGFPDAAERQAKLRLAYPFANRHVTRVEDGEFVAVVRRGQRRPMASERQNRQLHDVHVTNEMIDDPKREWRNQIFRVIEHEGIVGSCTND